MEKIGTAEIKKFEPRKDYFCPLIRFPWKYGEEIIGRGIDIYKVEGGYYLKFTDEELLQHEYKEESLPERMNRLEIEIDEIKTHISGKKPQKTNELTKQDGPARIRTGDLRRVKAMS